MDLPWRMRNPILNYTWGSHTTIAALLGERVPSDQPQAELWMGAHPKAPSEVWVEGAWVPLADRIAQNPKLVLGEADAEKFNGRLPFLFKILAAEKPLSIQAHPDAIRAKEGFLRENQMGIPLDAPHRNYRDPNPKPELLCALTPFWALCGFRKIQEILETGSRFASKSLKEALGDLKRRPDAAGLKSFFTQVMTLDGGKRKSAIDEAVSAARACGEKDPVSRWISALYREYPEDTGVLSPLFLNLIKIHPGSGIFLPAGILHAYLEGAGLELMANSDNVLRGGLTTKHVDLPALLDVLDFEPYDPKRIAPVPAGPCEALYQTPSKAFCLSRIDVSKSKSYRRDNTGAEILLCLEGSGWIEKEKEGKKMPFRKGQSFLIPAAVSGYRIQGEGLLYKASVPDP